MVEVRRFREFEACARPERARFFEGTTGFEVDADLLHTVVRTQVGAGRHQARERDERGAVVIPGQVGVDAADAFENGAVAPRSRRITGGEDDASAPHRDRHDHVEDTVAVPDRRRPHPATGRHVLDAQLLHAGGHIADLGPFDEVGAVVHGDPRKVFEGRGDDVEIVADAHNTRVGIEARDERVRVVDAGPSPCCRLCRHGQASSLTVVSSGRSATDVPTRRVNAPGS